MSATSTHFKLGLFTLIALVALVATAFGLGIRGAKADTVTYHTYFDESVVGLEIGSPVKYRGVLIGNVGAIRIAPDRKHVEVKFAIEVREATRLDLATKAPEVRAQLGTQGITGVKFIDIDFFDPKTSPAPELPFPVGDNYIPATPSFMRGIEQNLDTLGQRLPALIDATVASLHEIQIILEDFRDQHVPAHLVTAIDNVGGVAGSLRGLVNDVDRAKLPEKTAAALDNMTDALAKVNVVLERIGGDGGLVASTQRATESIGDLGRSTSGGADQLEVTLRDLDEAVQAIRDLADAIDRDPDMLVKGRARGKHR